MGFLEQLAARRTETGAVLCIGLDPDLKRMPPHIAEGPKPLFEFCRRIITATAMHGGSGGSPDRRVAFAMGNRTQCSSLGL